MAPRPLDRWASQRAAADSAEEAEEAAGSGASAGHVEGDRDSEKDEKKNSEEKGEEDAKEDAKEDGEEGGEEGGEEDADETEGTTSRDESPASHVTAGHAIPPHGGFRQTPYGANEDLGSLLRASRSAIYAGTDFAAQDTSNSPPHEAWDSDGYDYASTSPAEASEGTHESADDADDEDEERPKKHRYNR